MPINYYAAQVQDPIGNALNAYQTAQDRRIANANAQQQQQMNALALKQAQQQALDTTAEREAYKQFGAQGLGAVAGNLMSQGLGKQAGAINAQIAEQQKQKLAMMKDQLGLMKTTAAGIMANPASAIDAVSRFGQQTGMDVSGELAQLQQMGGNPDAVRQWAAARAMDADKLLPQFQKFDQGGAVVTGRVNPVTGAFEAGGAYQKSMSPGEVASNQLARARLAQDASQFAQSQATQRMGMVQPTYNAELGGFVGRPTAENPGGTFTPLAGGAAKEKPLTEGQSKAAVFGARMQNADQIIDDLQKKGAGAAGWFKYAPNVTTPHEVQMQEQAQRDFVNAVLRKESGAAISESEFDNAEKQYFPKVGDSKEVLAQKKRNRDIATRGMLEELPPNRRDAIVKSIIGETTRDKIDKYAAPSVNRQAPNAGVQFLGFE